MVHFSLNIKTCCLYVIWEKQDQNWAKIFCIPKNMHSRTPMLEWKLSIGLELIPNVLGKSIASKKHSIGYELY